MLRKYLLIPAVLAIGSLLMATDSSQAASRGGRGGGGRGGGGRAAAARSVNRGGGGRAVANRGGANRGNAYRGGSYGARYAGRGYNGRGYNGGGYYGRDYYGGWPYFGGWYGGYLPGLNNAYQPYWADTYPYVDSYPYYDYSYAPAVPYYSGQAAPSPAINGAATIEVIVPNPQAAVVFDGVMTNQAGTDRVFTTPPLTSNGTYRIRASWSELGRMVTQERVVSVAPDQTTVVDFTRPAGG